MAWTATLTVTLGAALAAVVYVVQITYAHRSRVNQLKEQGVVCFRFIFLAPNLRSFRILTAL